MSKIVISPKSGFSLGNHMEILIIIVIALIFFSLHSCSKSATDADDSMAEVEYTGAKILVSDADLPTCDSNSIGRLYYVLDNEEFKVCGVFGYSIINLTGPKGNDGEDGATCTAQTIDEGVEVSCDGVVIDTIVNGVDGVDGQNGIDGSSCDVVDNKDGTYTLSCENGDTVTLRDGINGADGVDGIDGVNGTNGTNGLDGADGIDGVDGADGISINWLGSLLNNPASPSKNDAFYWGGISCIWDGDSWEILAKDGGIPSPTKCEKEFTDVRDGIKYSWVKIGTQIWMKENLKYSGDSENGDFANEIGVCYGGVAHEYNTNCFFYGRLYEWAEAMQIDAAYNTQYWDGDEDLHQGVCPPDWHLPSDNEWEVLASYVANDAGLTSKTGSNWDAVGQMLKGGNKWRLNSNITNDDSYGLSIYPAGYKADDGVSYSIENYALLLSTENGSTTPAQTAYRRLGYSTNSFDWVRSSKLTARSVRCIYNGD